MSEHIVQVRKIASRSPALLTYCYGSPLEVGDVVMCPANEYSGPFLATVTVLGRGLYQGPVRGLLCRVAPDRLEPA